METRRICCGTSALNLPFVVVSAALHCRLRCLPFIVVSACPNTLFISRTMRLGLARVFLLVGFCGGLSVDKLRASCYCGAVSLAVARDARPLASSICHCQTCRRLTGAPFLANLVFAPTDVELETTAGLAELRTSEHVVRRRCACCHAPVLAELTTSRRVVVPAALFDSPPPEWRAQHHIYYDRRVMDVPDGLAKFRTNFGGEKCDDRGDSLPPAPD